MGVTDGAFKVKMHHPFSRTRILRQSGSSPTGLICFAMNKKHRRTPQHPTVTWHWLPMTTAHLTWDSTCHMLLLLLSFPKWWQNGWCHENGEERNEIWDRSKVKALTMQKQVFCWDVLSYFPHSAESSQPSFPSMRNLELVRCTMMFFFTPHTGYKETTAAHILALFSCPMWGVMWRLEVKDIPSIMALAFESQFSHTCDRLEDSTTWFYVHKYCCY